MHHFNTQTNTADVQQRRSVVVILATILAQLKPNQGDVQRAQDIH